MLYLAPIKYYNADGQIRFYEILADFFGGELDYKQFQNITNNIRLLEPKSYRYLIRYLYKHPLNVKGD
jgi:hypothetical protein